MPKGRASYGYSACNFCSLSGLLFGNNVTVLLAPRGEHFFCLSHMLSKYKPEERRGEEKEWKGKGKGPFIKQDFNDRLLFVEASVPPPDYMLNCNLKIF